MARRSDTLRYDPKLMLLALALSVSAQAHEVLTEIHPDAPAETAQFAFLIGDWDCAMTAMTPDGKGTREIRATWSGRLILGGWAIQDHWYSVNGGIGGWGTNLRWWNAELGRWENQWLNSRANKLSHFYADKVGETMVMLGGQGESAFGSFIDRNTFYDIGADAFRWRKDRSFDDGESWVQGVSKMLCTQRT